MISSTTASAYSSPYSVEFLKDYQQVVEHRIATTEQVVKANDEKMQKTLDPELTKLFNVEFKTVIDLYA